MRKQLRTKHILQAKKALAALPPAASLPRQQLSRVNAVKRLRPEIERARGQGYSYEDISELLLRHDLDIKPATLKAYMNRVDNELRSESPRVRPASDVAISIETADRTESILKGQFEDNVQEQTASAIERNGIQTAPSANDVVPGFNRELLPRRGSE